MKNIVILSFLFFSFFTKAQDKIEWDGKYQLNLTDFSPELSQIGEVNIFSLHTASFIDFYYQMTEGEFMFTKNFNSMVGCSFKPMVSSIIAPDTLTALYLLNFARYQFDLSELYARKLRQKLYAEKNAFSEADFYKPLYDQILKEYSEREAGATKDTDLGRNTDMLKKLHEEVLMEIQELSGFCKTCKPNKKKK